MNALYRSVIILNAVFIVFFISNGALAQGDNCATAVAVVPGIHVADGPATGGGFEGTSCDPNSLGGAFNADWYSFTPATNGLARVFQCPVDTRVNIRTGVCGSQVCVSGNDDDSTPSGSGACNNACCGSSTDFTTIGGTEYFIEWDDRWTSSGFTWTLEFHDCEAPVATFQKVNDCPNFQYSIEVDLTNLGTSATVDIVNDGGAPPILGATVGTYSVGPFISGSIVSVNLVHDADPFCDLSYGPVTNAPCPIVSCGPDNYTYCYGDNDTTMFIFQATSSDPLAIQFNAGGISTFGDIINIHDGDNTGAPLLFTGDNGGDLSGIVAVSTNPGGYLLLQVISSAFTSCQSGGVSPIWDWDIACLDCTQPSTTITVVEDCIHKQYFVEVDITDLGDAGTVDIVNDIGIPPTLGVGIGTYQVGPIEMDNFVEVSVVHDANPLCSINSEPLVAYFDSCAIDCGNTVYDYCYMNNDTAWFLFESGTGLPITMHFYDGKIAASDQLVVYNGKTTLSAVLFNTINGYNMNGVTLQANNPDGALLMRLYSDNDISCDDGGVSPELEWFVGCGAVGIPEQQDDLNNMFIYPNPSNGSVSILYGSPTFQEITINVIDDLGRVIKSEQKVVGPDTRIELDLNALENGSYLIQIDSATGSIYEKLMIRH